VAAHQVMSGEVDAHHGGCRRWSGGSVVMSIARGGLDVIPLMLRGSDTIWWVSLVIGDASVAMLAARGQVHGDVNDVNDV
jgi:hypothetical protein